MSPSKIVITGTIASGKSTLSMLLEKLGYKVLSSDEINKELLKKGKVNYLAIKNSGKFDQAFIGGDLDKKKLASIIFSNKEKMMALNQITHKNILDEINRLIVSTNDKAVFVEIPLYFQMKEKFDADEVWLVVADSKTQLQRLMDRDKIDIDYAKSKIERQEDLINMKAESDVVFDNSKSITELMDQLKEVLNNKDLL